MRRPPIAATGIALALAVLLSGCTGGGTYASQTASRLQHSVADVATAAQGKDYAGALSRLAALEQANDAALKAGTIDSGRHDAIAATISTVRADLTRLQDAAERARLQAQLQQLQQQQQQQQQKGNDGKGKKGDGGGGDGG